MLGIRDITLWQDKVSFFNKKVKYSKWKLKINKNIYFLVNGEEEA